MINESGFIKDVSTYFMDFLQSNFKSNRLPKRLIKSVNERNLKISFSVTKNYPGLDEKIKKIFIEDGFKEDVNVRVKKGLYTKKPNKETLDLFQKIIESIKIESIDTLNELISGSIKKIAIENKSDPEIAYDFAEQKIKDHFQKEIITNILEKIEPLIQSQSIEELDSIIALEQGLTETLTNDLLEQIKNIINLLLIDQESKVEDEISKIVYLEKIHHNLKLFFETFNVGDAYAEIVKLNNSLKVLDKQKMYLYFGEIKLQNNKFPLFYLPLEISENISESLFSLETQNELFINKKAIDYATQEFNKLESSKNKIVLDERKITPSECEKLISTLQNLVREIENQFKNDGMADFTKKDIQKSKSVFLEVNNNISFAIFDTSDESIINDYEKILELIQKEDSEIGDLFRKIIVDFLTKDPEAVISEIENNWDDKPVSDRLNYVSPIPLNTEQLKIISALRNDNCKYIKVEGPPGTGKSHTISAIAFDYILNHKSILIISDKKEALDVVENKITNTLEQIRPEGFQNPILRLGKMGNTYSKILAPQSLEKLRDYHRAQKHHYDQIKLNIKETDKNLKKLIDKDLDIIKKLKNEKMRSYLINHNNLIDKKYDPEEINNFLKDNANAKKVISKAKEILGDEIIKNLIIKYDIISISKLKDFLEDLDFVYKLFSSPYSKPLLSSDVNADLVNLFKIKEIKFENIEEVENIIEKFKKFKNSFFKFGKIKKINEFSKFIQSNLALKKDFEENDYLIYERLVFLIKIFRNKFEIDNKEILHWIKFLEKTMSKIKIHEFNELNKIIKNCNTIISAYELFDEIPITKDKNNISSTDINSLTGVDLEFITGELIENEIALEKEISSIQNNLNLFDYVKLQEEKQELYTNQMAYNMDESVLNFADNNHNLATTLRKVIKSKQPFPTDRFSKVQFAFPCIIASVRDFAEYIGLKKDIFDLIIIDEASQVSIAQAFPALLRAEKVLVLGDKRQFSNVQSGNAAIATNNFYKNKIKESFKKNIGKGDFDSLSMERVKNFDIKVSILDFFDGISNYRAMLRKHFRGYKEHISYCSKTFYENNLQAIRINSKPIDDIIKFTILDEGEFETGNINKVEANFIIKKLEDMIKENKNHSIGIITPFKDQQSYITELISKHDEREHFYNNFRIKVMTFDSCQGEEREIIFYSMVANQSKDKLNTIFPSSLSNIDYDEDNNKRAQRLNVGFSRVQECMHFVLSKKPNEFSSEIGNAIMHFNNVLNKSKELPKKEELDPSSKMESKVLNWITETPFYNENVEKIEIKAQFPIGEYIKQLDSNYTHPSYKTDFFLIYNNGEKTKNVIIEYDGFEAHFQNFEMVNEFNFEEYYTDSHYERQKVLESYGYKFIRLNRFNCADDPVGYLNKKLVDTFIVKKKI